MKKTRFLIILVLIGVVLFPHKVMAADYAKVVCQGKNGNSTVVTWTVTAKSDGTGTVKTSGYNKNCKLGSTLKYSDFKKGDKAVCPSGTIYSITSPISGSTNGCQISFSTSAPHNNNENARAGITSTALKVKEKSNNNKKWPTGTEGGQDKKCPYSVNSSDGAVKITVTITSSGKVSAKSNNTKWPAKLSDEQKKDFKYNSECPDMEWTCTTFSGEKFCRAKLWVEGDSDRARSRNVTKDDVNKSKNDEDSGKYNKEAISKLKQRKTTDCNGIFGSVTDKGTDGNPASLAYIFQQLFNYLKILGPLLVIVLSGLDFTKTVLSGDDEGMQKATKKLGIRLVLVVLLYFIPDLAKFILSILNGGLKNPTCGIK